MGVFSKFYSHSNLDGIYNAIAEAKKETSKPTIIKLSTIIGYGSTAQGTHGVHGSRKLYSIFRNHCKN